MIRQDRDSHQPSVVNFDDIAAMRTGVAPLYHSLGHIIRSKIEGGEWQPGDQIPSERQLMEMCGLSRATIRQGIEYLVREGVLYRVQGKGTFVASPKLRQGVLRLSDYADTMRRNGLNPAARLLGHGRGDPPVNVRKALALADTEDATWFQRLLLVGDAPMMIETCYVVSQRFPDLEEAYDGSEDIHHFLDRRYGVRMSSGSESFEPVILESHEAGLLGVRAGVPALWVEQLGLDAAGKPLVFCSTLLRGDRCRFYVRLALS